MSQCIDSWPVHSCSALSCSMVRMARMARCTPGRSPCCGQTWRGPQPWWPSSACHRSAPGRCALSKAHAQGKAQTRAATVLRADPEGSPALVAFISTQPRLSSAEVAQLDGRLRGSLPFHLIPALLQPTAEPLPLQSGHEVPRLAVPRLACPRADSGPPSCAELAMLFRDDMRDCPSSQLSCQQGPAFFAMKSTTASGASSPHDIALDTQESRPTASLLYKQVDRARLPLADWSLKGDPGCMAR